MTGLHPVLNGPAIMLLKFIVNNVVTVVFFEDKCNVLTTLFIKTHYNCEPISYDFMR